MEKLLYNLLMMSISGSIMFALSSLVSKAGRRSNARWYYAMLAAAVMMFLLPLHLLTQTYKFVTVSVPQTLIVSGGTAAYAAHSQIAAISPLFIVTVIWGVPAAALLVYSFAKYAGVSKTLAGISRKCTDENVIKAYRAAADRLRIRHKITLYRSEAVTSPLLFGIVRPRIILPSRDFSQWELDMIMAHELTHYLHKDLIIKMLAKIVSCLHWFNPVTRMLIKAIDEGCELCCDESVIDRLCADKRKDYGNLIISVMEYSPVSRSFTATMASVKTRVKSRLRRIVEFKKPSYFIRTAAAMGVLSLALCSVTVFGFEIVSENLPNAAKEVIGTPTDSDKAPLSETAENAAKESTVSPLPTQNDAAAQTATPVAETAAPEEQTARTAAEDDTAVRHEDTYSDDLRQSEELPQDEDAVVFFGDADGSGTVSEDEIPPETAEVSDIQSDTDETYAEYTTKQIPLIRIVTLPDSSYQFNPDFSDGAAEVKSDVLYATTDVTVSMYRRSGSADCTLKVYHITDYGDELIYDKQTMGVDPGYNLKIRFSDGEMYYVTAGRGDSDRASVYIEAQSVN